MRRIAGQNNDATGWISLHLIAIEPIAEPDVENAGHDCVDPVLGVSVRHQLHTGGHFDSHQVGTGLRGLTDKNGEADRGGNAGNGFQSMSSGRIELETGLAWLMGFEPSRPSFRLPPSEPLKALAY